MAKGNSGLGARSHGGAETNNAEDEFQRVKDRLNNELQEAANALNDTKEGAEYAKSIYDITPTFAYPSNQRIVNTVPSLKEMQTQMNEAPIGTTIAFYVGDVGGDPVTAIFKKESTRVWTMGQIVKQVDNDSTKAYGAKSRYQGMKALQMLSSAHQRSNGRWKIDPAIIRAYEIDYGRK